MYIKIHVYPGMKKEKVTKTSEQRYEFVLREPAERNLANKRTRELVAAIYKLPVAKVRMIAGHRSPSKVFELPDN